MMKKLQATAKKITWLSTKSRELTGQPFVNGKINLMNANECYALVKNFYLAAATATDVAVAF
jgi:hypothetical protein